jgi:serine/threonine-protein kinase PRP4
VAIGGLGLERAAAAAAVVDDVQYDEEDLRDIESFLEERDEEVERQREVQLAEERRKRRMDIEAKYASESKASNADPSATLAAAAKGGSSGGWAEMTGSSGAFSGESAETELAPTTSTSVPSASGKLAELNLADDRDAAAQSEGMQLAVERSALQAEERLLSGAGKFAFDMFSASPSGIDDPAMLQPVGRRALREALLEGEDPHLQSNWDDGEGYYKARIGELVGDRFQILGVVGKGVFSTVLKCLDLRLGDGTQPVAIKMIRSNDTMRRAAEKEKAILLTIAEHDPQNKRFCVRLLTHLEYRNHVALVFEYQSMNLREALKKFGKDVGINIGAIRMYGRQLFVALKHLMDLRIVHADLKLDNILCSGDLKQVKLCDFGSAFRETDTDNDPTPYLVSRFYRAPEIILGMPCKLID